MGIHVESSQPNGAQLYNGAATQGSNININKFKKASQSDRKPKVAWGEIASFYYRLVKRHKDPSKLLS